MLILTHIRDNFANAFFPRLSEWTPAILLAGLGWLLSINPDLMATGTGKGYVLMLSIAAQGVWSNMMVLIGVLRLVILVINGAWVHSPFARMVMAILSCFFWTQIMLSFAPILGFAFAMALIWLLQDFVNIIRTARDWATVKTEMQRRRAYAAKDKERRAESDDLAGSPH